MSDVALDRVCFEAGLPEVVVSSDARRAAGLHHWVDGTLGIIRTGDHTLVMAPNGPRMARHDLSAGGFLAGLETTEQPLVAPRRPVDHASGGPMHRDPESGALLLVYHGERFLDGDPADFWSFLGMAVSHDEGRTFVDLGPIVTSPLAEGGPRHLRPVEVGPGGFVVRDGWWWLYFLGRGIFTTSMNLGVARARVSDVVAAAERGEAPAFTKYHRGRWDRPALGGVATDLLPGGRHRLLWFDVALVPALDATLLVSSTVGRGPDGRPRWQHLARLSGDGLTWSTARRLYPEGHDGEILYVSVDSGGPEQRRIDGDTFDLYRVASQADYRWDDARLERVAVSWRVEGT